DGHERAEFLRTMYSELWDNINRHVLVVWQPTVVLSTAFVAMLLRDADLLQPDFGTALMITASAWVVAHTLDASSWFNRNLAILRNIEREFLIEADIRRIQPFFARDHRAPKLAEYFLIQLCL